MDFEPSRLSWTFTDLASADSHTVNCHFSCSARIADQPADKRMFAEVFPTQAGEITSARITAHFERALRSTLTTLISQCKAADVVGGPCPQNWITALSQATNALAFACGLELLPPFQLELESTSLQRSRLEEIARSRAEHRAAGHMENLQRATELLKQFKAMRQCAPEVSASKLLEKLSPADRGSTFQNLLLATSGQTTQSTLWAVAGSNLLEIDARATPPRVRSIPLPTELGPCRSVQIDKVGDETRFLIGAQRGVISVSRNDPSKAQLYPCNTGESQLGFNRVVATETAIHASHSELGIVTWLLDKPSDPAIFGEPGAKHLHCTHGSRLIYATGNSLIVREGSSRIAIEPRSNAEIIGIITMSSYAIAIHQDGTLVTLDPTQPNELDVRRRQSLLTAACAMPWLGETRLLLATDQGPVDCVGLEDSVTTEYLSPYRGLRILSATADLIAAVSPDRQRIVLWNSWDGQRPIDEIHVTSQTKHRIADVRFG